MLSAQPSGLSLDIMADALQDILETVGHLGQIGVFTGSPTISKDTLLADLVALAPTYSSYAEQDFVPQARRHNGAGDRIIPGTPVVFQRGGGDTGGPDTITGYYVSIWDGAAMVLHACELLPAPVTLTDEFDALPLDINLMFKNLPVYGGQVEE